MDPTLTTARYRGHLPPLPQQAVQTLRQMYALPGDSLCPGQLPGNQYCKSKLF
jgi:hypothetical protein